MSLNLGKTNMIVFRSGRILRDMENWLYNGNDIEVVSYCKYLGVCSTPKLIWTRTKELLASEAKKVAYIVFVCYLYRILMLPTSGDMHSKLFFIVVIIFHCYHYMYFSLLSLYVIHTQLCKPTCLTTQCQHTEHLAPVRMT